MHVTELNQDELWQLKDTLYLDLLYNPDGLPELTEEQKQHIEDALYSSDISDEVVFDIYDGYEFSKDDFWCNLDTCQMED